MRRKRAWKDKAGNGVSIKTKRLCEVVSVSENSMCDKRYAYFVALYLQIWVPPSIFINRGVIQIEGVKSRYAVDGCLPLTRVLRVVGPVLKAVTVVTQLKESRSYSRRIGIAYSFCPFFVRYGRQVFRPSIPAETFFFEQWQSSASRRLRKPYHYRCVINISIPYFSRRRFSFLRLFGRSLLRRRYLGSCCR